MSFTKSDFPVTPAVTKVILDRMNQVSAIQKLAQRVEIDGNGLMVSTVKSFGAKHTLEGAAKSVHEGAVDSVQVKIEKFAVIVSYTDETEADINGAVAAIAQRAVESLAIGVDEAIFVAGIESGDIPKLSGLVPVEVDSWRSFMRAMNGTGSNLASGIALNTALLSELQMIVNEKSDLSALDIQVLEYRNSVPVSGTINGFRFEVIAQSDATKTGTPLGFVGPFSTKAYWGIVPGSLQIKNIETGYSNPDGTAHFLEQHNEKAILVEVRFGFYANPAEFRSLTVAEEALGE